MASRNPYEIIKHRHITEKTMMLQELKNSKSNKSIAGYDLPKYVFIVDPKANKYEIAKAIEEIYHKLNVKVVGVNTINVKAKPTRRSKFRRGLKASFKKAIVTLEAGDDLDKV